MELNQLSRIIFQDKKSYNHIDPEEKEKLFFIFNRVISRGLPQYAELINRKGIDKALALDIWFEYAKNTNMVPKWYTPNWGKLKMGKNESALKKYDDVDKWILSHYPEAIEAEKERIEKEKEDSIEVIKKRGAKKKKK
jgi:hypothetical protein